MSGPVGSFGQESTGEGIVEAAASSEDLETFNAALKAGGLVDTVSGDAPVTILAPTDEAFKELSDALLERLLQPEGRERLSSLLK
jgi:uncharacterized surface protein with fasciclin (FAS1) repeats